MLRISSYLTRRRTMSRRSGGGLTPCPTTSRPSGRNFCSQQLHEELRTPRRRLCLLGGS